VPKGDFVMLASPRPALALSTLSPLHIDLTQPGKALFVCPDCGRWLRPRRGLAPAHRAGDEVTRCAGSARRLSFDIQPDEWRAAVVAERRRRRERAKTAIKNLIEPSTRRATVARSLVYPPVAPAICQMAAARA
jgi:hypothetical protein